MKDIQTHICNNIGATFDDDITFEQKLNCDGVNKYWIAKQKIGTLFGSEVDGECSGIGNTKEEALKRLEEDKTKLADSLWAE